MEIHELCPGCMGRVTEEQMHSGCPHCGYRLPVSGELAPHILAPYTVLEGKYMIGRTLGAGGCGITYLGYDLNLEMRIAIKEYYPVGFVSRDIQKSNTIISEEGDKGVFFSDGKKKYIQEARMLARFAGLRNIVSVRDYFEENNTCYIIMEYLDGETLKSYLTRKGGRISGDEMMRMLQPLLASLNEVHRQGLIHRDISPDNIMILRDGTLKLLDFGSARDMAGNAERSASVMLKPGYAPEEQYRMYGEQGTWTDVYALCATIYRCLTGHTPVDALSRKERDTLIPPSRYGVMLTPVQEAALLKGMAVNAEQRFKTIGEFYRGFYCNEIPTAQPVLSKEPQRNTYQPGVPQGTPQNAYQPGVPQGMTQNAYPTGAPQGMPPQNAYRLADQPYSGMPGEKKKRSGAVVAVSVLAAAALVLLALVLWVIVGKQRGSGEEPAWSQGELAEGENGSDSGEVPSEDDDSGLSLEDAFPQGDVSDEVTLPNGLAQSIQGAMPTDTDSMRGLSQSLGGDQAQQTGAPRLRYEFPEEFRELSEGLFCAPNYPNDTSNISVMTSDNDPITFQYTEETFCESVEELYRQYYDIQVDIKCTEFTRTTINGYNALIIRVNYNLMGVALEQVQCSVETEKDKVTTITMSQPAGGEWTDAFERVLDSIYVE